MQLYIPMATGQTVPMDVLKSIAMQDIDIDLIPCVTDGVIDSNHDKILPEDHERKITGECSSRNLAVSLAPLHGDFVAMQDRDIVHLFADNFKTCINFLKDNLDFGAVALPWKEYKIVDHIRILAFVCRSTVFKRLYFNDHTCESTKKDIEAHGLKFGFLPSDKRRIVERA